MAILVKDHHLSYLELRGLEQLGRPFFTGPPLKKCFLHSVNNTTVWPVGHGVHALSYPTKHRIGFIDALDKTTPFTDFWFRLTPYSCNIYNVVQMCHLRPRGRRVCLHPAVE